MRILLVLLLLLELSGRSHAQPSPTSDSAKPAAAKTPTDSGTKRTPAKASAKPAEKAQVRVTAEIKSIDPAGNSCQILLADINKVKTARWNDKTRFEIIKPATAKELQTGMKAAVMGVVNKEQSAMDVDIIETLSPTGNVKQQFYNEDGGCIGLLEVNGKDLAVNVNGKKVKLKPTAEFKVALRVPAKAEDLAKGQKVVANGIRENDQLAAELVIIDKR